MKAHNKQVRNRIEQFLPLVIIILAIISGILIIGIQGVKDNIEQHKYDNVAVGRFMFPDGFSVEIDENLFDIIYGTLGSDEYTKGYKKELISALEAQGFDTEPFEYYMKKNEIKNGYSASELYEAYAEKYKPEDEEDEDSENESTKTVLDSSAVDELKETLNEQDGAVSKSLVNHETLADAEESFGNELGLYNYVDALPNWQMIAAYTVEDNEFMQCIYAVNSDGTAITEDEDIEENSVDTLTIKLSYDKSCDELAEVYDLDSYEYSATMQIYGHDISLVGNSENKIKVIYFKTPTGRNYALYSSVGMSYTQSESLVAELISNLSLIDADILNTIGE